MTTPAGSVRRETDIKNGAALEWAAPRQFRRPVSACSSSSGSFSGAQAKHGMSRGGMFMDIKHTHPEYATPEDRRQALLDTKRLCTAVLLARKEAASKRSA